MKYSLPLFVYTTKSKTPKSKFILNLNNYRNAHYQVLNNSKVRYKEEIQGLFSGLHLMGKYELWYTYYAQTNRKCDVANICAIIDKYTCDTLTELGVWGDDNIDTVVRVVYQWGGVDKENQRCEFEIKECIDK